MRLFSVFAVLVLAVPTWADSAPEDYLDKEGHLKAALEVSDLQGGFAGFNGMVWHIKTDGAATAIKQVARKEEVVFKGNLDKKQLESLAKALATYDLAGLKSSGKAMANPHVIGIKWGKEEHILNLAAGSGLPKADAKTVEGRYAGIVGTVRSMVGAKEKEK